MPLASVVIRVPVVETGSGKVGYMLARGDADGTWRITEKSATSHDLVALCDTPAAFMPALKDHLDDWLARQRAMYDHNVAVVKSWPTIRPGWRPNWKHRELVKEAQQMVKAQKSYELMYFMAAHKLLIAGWITALPLDVVAPVNAVLLDQ